MEDIKRNYLFLKLKHICVSRLMFVLLGTTVLREQGTDFLIRVQWDFTENFLLQFLSRIAVFASPVTFVIC